MRRLHLAPVAALVLVLVSACSVSVGNAQVSTDELETQVSALLAEEVGRAPEQVDCPDPLDAEAGAEVRCTLTDRGATYGITVTATDVVDDEVALDVVVDAEPQADGES